MSEHTSTPWRYDANVLGTYGIIANEGPIVVQPAKAFCEADAAFIVRAVNSHDDLVKALEPFVALANTVFELYETRPGEFREAYGDKPDDQKIWSFNHASLTYGHLRAARAALAKAKGEA